MQQDDGRKSSCQKQNDKKEFEKNGHACSVEGISYHVVFQSLVCMPIGYIK